MTIDSETLGSLLLLLVGGGLTALGTLLGSWIKRRDVISNRLFESRLEAVDQLWAKLTVLKRMFGAKIGLGQTRWLAERGEEAEAKLEEFRTALDNSQVILDASVVEAFKAIESYFFEILDRDEHRASEYAAELTSLVKSLERSIQANLRKTSHRIRLTVQE